MTRAPCGAVRHSDGSYSRNVRSITHRGGLNKNAVIRLAIEKLRFLCLRVLAGPVSFGFLQRRPNHVGACHNKNGQNTKM